VRPAGLECHWFLRKEAIVVSDICQLNKFMHDDIFFLTTQEPRSEHVKRIFVNVCQGMMGY
jgi:hypothetical protein